jgi:phage terminase small subunit
MPRTDGIGGNGKRPHAPAKGCDGGRGKSCSTHVGHLLLPFKTSERFTPLEAKFITEFLKDPVAPPADIAIRAGYSPRTATQQANIILRRPKILAEIEDQMHAFVQRERLSIERLVRHLIELAEVDKRDFYNDNGSLKQPGEWTKPMASLIQGMTVSEIWDAPGSRDKVQTGELKKITLTNHLEPIKMLAKSLQGFIDRMEVKSQALNYHKHEHTVKGGMGDIDFNVLPENDLMVLKGLYDKARELTRAKKANRKQLPEGRA